MLTLYLIGMTKIREKQSTKELTIDGPSGWESFPGLAEVD